MVLNQKVKKQTIFRGNYDRRRLSSVFANTLSQEESLLQSLEQAANKYQ